VAIKTEETTAEQAWERSQWCAEAVETLRNYSRESDHAASAWWDDECEKPEWLSVSFMPGSDVRGFIEQLQTEGYEWAEAAGGLAAEEDGFGSTENDAGRSTGTTVERVADYFVGYLFDRYQGTRHVRRVATWLGFLLKAIERVAADSLSRNRSRQLTFEYRDRRFKARYDHHAGPRGGIEIVEVLPGRGAPEGEVAVTITSLTEAEDVYHTLESRLDTFIG